jgi:hypothetical protein
MWRTYDVQQTPFTSHVLHAEGLRYSGEQNA